MDELGVIAVLDLLVDGPDSPYPEADHEVSDRPSHVRILDRIGHVHLLTFGDVGWIRGKRSFRGGSR